MLQSVYTGELNDVLFVQLHEITFVKLNNSNFFFFFHEGPGFTQQKCSYQADEIFEMFCCFGLPSLFVVRCTNSSRRGQGL